MFLALLSTHRAISRGVGFDVSRAAIALAQDMASELPGQASLEFRQIDATAAWPEGEFDVVSMIDLLHHVDPASQFHVLTLAASKVRPGGILLYKDMAMEPRWCAWCNQAHDLIMARQWVPPCAVLLGPCAFGVDRHGSSRGRVGRALLVRARMGRLPPFELRDLLRSEEPRGSYRTCPTFKTDHMNNFTVVILAAVCALLTTAGQIVLKTGVSDPGLAGVLQSGGPIPFLMRAVITPLVITGLVLYVASSGLWLLILARADVSFAFPLVSMGFVLTVAYAHFVFTSK